MFSQISNLKRHERVHAGEKNFKCEICQKKFSTMSNLKQHMHVHEKGDTREKYFCEVCNKMYLYRSSLRKHLQEHEEAGHVISLKDTISTNDVATPENVSADTKVESEFNIYGDCGKNRNQIEELEEEDSDVIFQEPGIEKYVFIDNSNVIKASPIDFKLDTTSLLEDNENPKSPDMNEGPSPKVNLNVFPDSPSAYLYRQDYDSDSKLQSMTPLVESPLRENNAADYQFLSNRKTASNVIRYKGELYYLYDRMLNRLKDGGELVIRQIDNDSTNPSCCHHLPEVSHYPDYESLIRVYKEIAEKSNGKVTVEMLLNEKNCNSLNGENRHQSCGDHHERCQERKFSLDNFLADFLREEKSTDHSDHLCLCEETRGYKHVHGPYCGHPAIWHDGHLDYIVDGKLHHQDGDHCDDHGPICIVDNTNDEFAYGLISNTMYSDTKFKPAASPLCDGF